MIRRFFTLMLRNFLRNGSYTIINVVGLSIGVTCCVILFLLIRYDLQFDQFHSKINDIYVVARESKNASGIEYSSITPYPFSRAFRNDFADVPLMTQVHKQGQTLVTIGEEKFMSEEIIFADSLFFDVFDFQVLSGNPSKELGEPGKVFVTKSFADKYFKGKDAKHFKLANVADFEVAGLIADPPPTSEIKFSIVASMPSLNKEILGLELDQWGMHASARAYIVLPAKMKREDIDQRFVPFTEKYTKENNESAQTYKLIPFKDFHFNKVFNKAAADKQTLIMLGILGVFILSVACVNFINLATALAVKKSKEIGIRKTLGAKRGQLTLHFLTETFVITVLSILVSLGVVEWMLPWLNSFLGKQLAESLFTHAALLGFVTLLAFVITLLSGFYPAVILSGYEPVAVLKNKITSASAGSVSVRKALVVFQFLIAQALIIGTLVVSDQMAYIHSAPLGFAKDAIIDIKMPLNKPEVHESFKQRLLANPNIHVFSMSLGAPVSPAEIGTNFNLASRPDESYDVAVKTVDENYFETYGLELVAGRWITETDAKLAGPPINWDDRKYVLVLNETAVKQLGFDKPEDILDKNVKVGINDIVAPVVGVVKDFHIASLHEKIQPVVLMNFPYFYYNAGIKVSTTDLPTTLSFIEKTWNELHPEYYFEYKFLDDYLHGLYRQEERTFTLFKIFSAIAIFIGCLGLYGLVSFMATQRLKEVGIRKVHGASIPNIVMLFSKEFIQLIAIAFAIASPLAWYLMREWLSGFAYNTGIHVWVFVAGLLATLVIALATVSYRSIKAAISNPVETLRME